MKPILFSTNMVRTILEGRKTVTRRVVKPQPKGPLVPTLSGGCWPGYFEEIGTSRVQRPPYRPGDILYVRETWYDPSGTGWPVLYKADMPMHWDADDTETGIAVDLKSTDYKWRPSIHMPREAARIFLRVTDVRVERLQDITESQAMKEGCNGEFLGTGESIGCGWEITPQDEFTGLWDSTIKPTDRAMYGWDTNPWVWVIEFERISREEAQQCL